MNTPTDRLADEIRAEMKRKRLTQERVAQAVGLSTGAYSSRLNGHTPWRFGEVEQVCAALDVDLADLIRKARVAA